MKSVIKFNDSAEKVSQGCWSGFPNAKYIEDLVELYHSHPATWSVSIEIARAKFDLKKWNEVWNRIYFILNGHLWNQDQRRVLRTLPHMAQCTVMGLAISDNCDDIFDTPWLELASWAKLTENSIYIILIPMVLAKEMVAAKQANT